MPYLQSLDQSYASILSRVLIFVVYIEAKATLSLCENFWTHRPPPLPPDNFHLQCCCFVEFFEALFYLLPTLFVDR